MTTKIDLQRLAEAARQKAALHDAPPEVFEAIAEAEMVVAGEAEFILGPIGDTLLAYLARGDF